jgi:hypothetical protein
MNILLRLILVLATWWVARGFYRAWRLNVARDKERRRVVANGRSTNLSDQEVSDADFEEIP